MPLCDSQKGGLEFPTDHFTKDRWIRAVRRDVKPGKKWTPLRHDVVCEDHFSDDDFKPAKMFAKLFCCMFTCVPSICNHICIPFTP
ncbi:MAG: THAP domain-containing protein [Gammaproteobacteria bacterium]|nr:THAP domain-containing protein [Gammaproteobacteria bacterium]